MSMPMYTERQDRVALGDMVRELFTKVSELINTHIELTKTEIKVESRKLAVAAAFGGAALIVGFISVFFLGFSLVLLLNKVIDLAWATVLTTLIMFAVTGVFAAMMIKEIKKNSETIEVE